jgi:hypothetical protein
LNDDRERFKKNQNATSTLHQTFSLLDSCLMLSMPQEVKGADSQY